MSCVYALVEESLPKDYRYIGRTSETPHRRLSKHYTSARTGEDTYVYRWMRKCMAEGKSVKIIVLEDNLSYEEAGIRETHYIKTFREKGFRLTNTTDGGDGGRLGQSGWKHTEEALAKMRGNKHCLGRKDSPETREKKRLSALGNKSNLGRKATEEAKANMRRAQQLRLEKGWKHTEETKERLSALARLRWEEKRNLTNNK